MLATPEFYKGTSMSSVVRKHNIMLQIMVLLLLSVKTQLTQFRHFWNGPLERWFGNSSLVVFLVCYLQRHISGRSFAFAIHEAY